MRIELTDDEKKKLGLSGKIEVKWFDEFMDDAAGFYDARAFPKQKVLVENLAVARGLCSVLIKEDSFCGRKVITYPHKLPEDFSHYELLKGVSSSFFAASPDGSLTEHSYLSLLLLRQETPKSEHIDSEKDIPL